VPQNLLSPPGSSLLQVSTSSNSPTVPPPGQSAAIGAPSFAQGIVQQFEKEAEETPLDLVIKTLGLSALMAAGGAAATAAVGGPFVLVGAVVFGAVYGFVCRPLMHLINQIMRRIFREKIEVQGTASNPTASVPSKQQYKVSPTVTIVSYIISAAISAFATLAISWAVVNATGLGTTVAFMATAQFMPLLGAFTLLMFLGYLFVSCCHFCKPCREKNETDQEATATKAKVEEEQKAKNGGQPDPSTVQPPPPTSQPSQQPLSQEEALKQSIRISELERNLERLQIEGQKNKIEIIENQKKIDRYSTKFTPNDNNGPKGGPQHNHSHHRQQRKRYSYRKNG
jgi:hypothetical protein